MNQQPDKQGILDKIKASKILAPLGIGAYGVGMGLFETKGLHEDLLNKIVEDQQSRGRWFMPFSNTIFKNKEIPSAEEFRHKLKEQARAKQPKNAAKEFAAYIDNHDILIHKESKVVEMIPKKSYIMKHYVPPKFMENLNLAKGPILKNTLLGGLTISGTAYGGKALDFIKNFIADHKATKKVASLVKEEIEKRAEEAVLDKIISKTCISEIVDKARK